MARLQERPVSGPTTVRKTLRTISTSSQMRKPMVAMRDREAEFSSPLAAALAGVAADPSAARYLDAQLDAMWRRHAQMRITSTDEVVIGAGLHAAIYCAVRVACGHPMPLVIEASDRVGGAFAASRAPAFYLNSRNRPGSLGFPGRPGGLNVLPGAVVQPCDLSGDEYQRNTDLALAIRATLAMKARVLTGRRAVAVTAGKRRALRVELEKGTPIEAERVLNATGLGQPKRLCEPHARVLTFPEFVALMDEPFPLRGMRRVAVIGAGDSGKTVIESLVGQGPAMGWSVASLDWIDTIDWYGVPGDRATRDTWAACSRSRYRGLGRTLPEAPGRPSRVTALTERGERVCGGYECAFVNSRPYDLVVTCVGYEPAPIKVPEGASPLGVGRRMVGRIRGGVWDIGPASERGFTDTEKRLNAQITQIPENATALFRWAGRTAALAAARATAASVDPLGVDRNGMAVYQGTIVNIVGLDKKGPVLGRCDDSPDLFGVGGIDGGGYRVDGKTVYGTDSSQIEVAG